ncbi:cellulose biosynthesis cyclic di-GMP-binding regulatory protein BcsB [Chimaeribacter arupi]|uniref:Cyclic di-GMP-binding protein n=1 Tax=Chimaeribacter arupi TaxID=2060066 RepID=A0A2N5EPK2_9GAMM|nr:cellulose biosynthesis cyclic di-GMP-binding regulatory protein BcsB [Chimaeribacter arupi]PLR51217.1 cellulose biosynthesis cyclic di-GMP-binding regulatory protein BcsB [Chimaeribacter arupi]
MNPTRFLAALRRTRPWLAAGLALLPLAVGQAEPAALDLSTLPRPADNAPQPDAAPPAPDMPAPDAPAPEAAVPDIALTQGVTTSLTLAEMGQQNGLTLSGGQLHSGVIFTLPGDQVMTNARLTLVLKVSPALLARDTSLQLMLNGQPLGALPLTGDGSRDNEYELDIPAAMVVSSNNLSFQVQDSNAMQCERDLSDKYWVTVLPKTRLQLEGQRLNIGRDLGHFPRPFFDPLQMKASQVTMVFPASLQPAEVSAAATVASYLGMRAGYRGIDFPVALDRLPEQNGIVFGKPGDRIGTLTLPATTGPQLQVIDNPINPVYKLLLVMGTDPQQLRQAAWRLVNAPLPAGQSTLPVVPHAIPPRQPYDAPRWINTHAPVSLKSLVANPDALTANGIYHDSIHVAFRAAPDLFMWDGDTIPVHLGYRFPTENWIDEDKSQLNVSINGTFLRNLTVNKNGLVESAWRALGGDTRQESTTLRLAPYLIYGDNQLTFYYAIAPKKDAPCNLLTSSNIKSRIDDDSYIDLTHTHHFSQLPNLSYYVGASFPFSRLADFSQTLLLLPAQPGAAELHTLLGLMGRAGNATGIPVAQVQVAFGVPGNTADRDVLAVAPLQDKAFTGALLRGTPFQPENDTLTVRTPDMPARLKAWATGDWFRTPVEADRYLSSTEAWRGFVSFPSAWAKNRVVVLATATDDDQLLKINQDLNTAAINAGVRGDLAVITDENGVRSFRVGPQFPVGQLPWYLMIVWYASQHIVVLSLVTLLFAAAIGLSIYVLLARHAAQRLAPHRGSAGKDFPDENE